MTKPSIGFIGLGLMGAAMVECLQSKGYALTVLGNVSRSSIDAAVARVDLPAEATVDPRQQRRQHQVGIGVGAGNPMLEPSAGGRSGRNAQRHRAIVDAPAFRYRHIEPRPEASIGFYARCENMEI